VWLTCGDWLLSFLLVLAVAPVSRGDAVPVVSVIEATLAPDWAWEPPIVRWSAVLWDARLPFWMYAAGMALVIVRFLRQAPSDSGGFERYSLLIALSLLARPVDLFAGAILLGARRWLSPRHGKTGWRRGTAVWLLLAFSAVTLCLEFSVILFVLMFQWVMTRAGQGGMIRWLPPLAAIITCGVAATLSRGFATALMRPVSWLDVPEVLIPMSPFLVDGWIQGLAVGLAVVCVGNVWRTIWQPGHINFLALLSISGLSLLALSCRYYTWLSLVGLLCIIERPVGQYEIPGTARRWRCVAAVVVLGCLIPQTAAAWLFVARGSWPAEIVDPAQWNSSGPVLLMEPATADRWRTRSLKGRHQVVIDDRWDLFADQYPMYRRLCRDLSEIRNSHYLLNDGTWGGYRHWVDLWKPSLLEVPASDTDSLRRLSLSPHWKVMGIDSRRVVFGLKDLPQNKPQIQVVATLFAELEWPSPQFDGDLQGAIVAVGDHQRMTVARVLLALRLPYAAMRLLPEGHRDSELVEALCYFELAHRAYRQTRTPSVLDQYRAVSQLRSLLDRGCLTDKQTVRIALGLEELGELQSAIDFAGHVAKETGGDDAASLPSRAMSLIERCRSELADGPSTERSARPDSQVRRALLAGRPNEARHHLEKLSNDARDFYGVLVSATDAGSEQLYRSLLAQLNRPEFPAALRAEATFYLGSLAVEIGDSPGAAQAFMESSRIDATLPLNSVARISLSGLRKPSRP